MLEATKDSIRLLSEATSDAIVDSLVLTRSVLEELYKSGEGGFSPEELQQDLATYQQTIRRIKSASDNQLEEQLAVLTSDGQGFLKHFREKYSDFLPMALINSYKALDKKIEGIEKVYSTVDLVLSSLEDLNPDSLSTIHSGLAILSEHLEQYISYFSSKGKLIEALKALVARILISTVSALDEIDAQASEERNYLIGVKNTARSILWQIDNYEEEKKSTVGDLLNWLETSPDWAGDGFEECLDYVNRTRK